ncbi:MAG: 4Fe-4S binding protein [Phycisphaerae bacterium]|nr:4Fe-4S binding protein [Phycisphaerae bacterium]
MRKMRKIVKIDEDKCNGCGLCVPSCAEGAIQIIDGKARLVADNLCDGIGNCLGECPQDAITIEQRPADEFNERAVETFKAKLNSNEKAKPSPDTATDKKLPCGCPGTMMRKLSPAAAEKSACSCPGEKPTVTSTRQSLMSRFPIQLSLLPTAGDMWTDADVVIAADCAGFAMPDFHEQLLTGGDKTLAVGCPKLDDISEYVEKLTTIFANNNIRSITVARMEVPCCNGIVVAVQKALEVSGKQIPLRDVCVGINGKILKDCKQE